MTNSEAKTNRNFGASIRRREDAPLLTGQALFVDDVSLPEMLRATMVRSPSAHAKILRIDATAALDREGFCAVYTAEDLGDYWAPVPIVVPPPPIEGMQFNTRTQVPLAKDVVRYAGEPLAMIIAESRYLAEDIAGDIVIDYEPLPVVVDLKAAASGDAPLVHEDAPGNVAAHVHQQKGSYASVVSQAATVIKRRLSYDHGMAQPMETRGLVADWDARMGRLTVWAATQAPTSLRGALAGLLGLSEQQVRVVAPFVGGGFGAKVLLFYPEELLVPWATIQLGRPVKWIEDRGEHFVATTHERGQIHDAEIALAEDGRILGGQGRLPSRHRRLQPLWADGSNQQSVLDPRTLRHPELRQHLLRHLHQQAVRQPVSRRRPAARRVRHRTVARRRGAGIGPRPG